MFSQKFIYGEIVYEIKKKIKAAAGWIGKEISHDRSSGNKSIFFLALGICNMLNVCACCPVT